MTACRTCSLGARRDSGDAPPWDSIVRTRAWDVVHAFGSSVVGWTVLVARRHITALADRTDEEALDLGPLIRNVSRALHQITGCRKTYVVQFPEHPDHPHVHVHVIPRPVDLPDELQGPGIFRQLGVQEGQGVPEVRMNEVALRLRECLAPD